MRIKEYEKKDVEGMSMRKKRGKIIDTHRKNAVCRGRRYAAGIARIIGLAVGILCFIWFLIPCAAAGILNIGNMTGLVLSALLILYTVFMQRIHDGILKLWNKRKARFPMAAAGGIIALCAVLAVIETGCMVGASTKTYAPNATAIVLGCRVYGESASLSLAERLEAAYEYLIENPDADCVVSGGQGPGEDISEAECMYRWLVNRGIDGSRIYKEDKSTSTEENIAYAKEVIEENGLLQEVVIITNEYHVYRAGIIAEDNGLSWGAKPGKTAEWLFPTYYVRELYAILAEWIF